MQKSIKIHNNISLKVINLSTTMSKITMKILFLLIIILILIKILKQQTNKLEILKNLNSKSKIIIMKKMITIFKNHNSNNKNLDQLLL